MIRQLLRGYLAVIYDTNLIIYQCFNFVEKSRDGQTDVVIDEPPFTYITRNITNYIKDSNKKVYTLQIMWRDELENNYDKFAWMVKHRMSDNALRISLGYQPGERMDDSIILKQLKKLIKNVKSLKHNSWLVIDETFKPNTSDISALKKFFNIKYQNSLGMHSSKKPDYVDNSLILYSEYKQFPLISNDNPITEFREELETKQYTYKIIPLMAFSKR